MKKKQIYALLTATVLMATSITGCSGKTTEETAVEETAETEEAPEEEAVSIPEEEEPVFQLDFRVWATREQIMALREYMLKNQIRFGKVE